MTAEVKKTDNNIYLFINEDKSMSNYKPIEPALFTISQVTQKLNCERKTIMSLVREGKLKAKRNHIRGKIWITAKSLNAYVES